MASSLQIARGSATCSGVAKPVQARTSSGASSSWGAWQSSFTRVHLQHSYLQGGALKVNVRASRAACSALNVQMNLFERMSRIVRSYANSVVSAAEDPEKILEQAVEDMQNDLIKMRQASAQVMASLKQMENKYIQAQTTSDDWYRRAELALKKGDEELAREALSRRKAFQDNATGLQVQVEQQRKAVDTLIGNTRALEAKLADAKSKKDTLRARAISAKTSKQINEMVSGLSTGKNAVSAFEKMEEKVLAMEAESEATQKLLPGSDDMEAKFRQLEGGGGVDDELSKMKAALEDRRPKAYLPEGRPLRDALDVELEELRRKSGGL